MGNSVSLLEYVTFYKRKTDRHIFLISYVVLAEKVQKRQFFYRNPIVEEFPRSQQVGDCADRIGQHKLRADGPIEPTDVAGMPEPAVNTFRDQDVMIDFFDTTTCVNDLDAVSIATFRRSSPPMHQARPRVGMTRTVFISGKK